MLSDSLRHLQQNAVDFRLLFIQQPDKFIVLLDGFKRFDEDGLSTGTRAMHHALYAPLLLDFYRNHETLAANCDQFILHRSAFGQSAQITAKRFLYLATLLFNLAANSC